MGSQIKQKSREEMEAALNGMSKKELIEIVMSATAQSEWSMENARRIITHLKVLCHRAGGTLKYTKAEFEKAAADDPQYKEDYVQEDGQEVCLLQVVTKSEESKEDKPKS